MQALRIPEYGFVRSGFQENIFRQKWSKIRKHWRLNLSDSDLASPIDYGS